MDKHKQTTEEQILEAAEQIFLDKGFKNSKISDIAELANVNNALINYYFRSKENLFNKVLHSKINLLAKSITSVIDQDCSFEEVIRSLVKTQYHFFEENESLPRFVISEILPDEERCKMFRKNFIPVVLGAGKHLDRRLQEEISAGNIRNITFFDLLYTITSINILCFLVKPIFGKTTDQLTFIPFSQVIENRENKNIDVVMNYLKKPLES